ncbi:MULTISPECIES: hypothetical protein [unclassified Crossiella]|uniref:hypothetical protein n=1 Tax=unclassified Crossiella TaxID=2620835 RepID=UPI001FFEB075|nr:MULTISPECIES: hypothetical protein [unclassified Crossiella]MCK2239264.1 hypothetical protein [Crossiella sp. S99.2]MCK2251166.1 hypothetical protein [Crossiella sp. S99.1]
MAYLARSVLATVLVLAGIGSVLLTATMVLVLLSNGPGAIATGAGSVVFYLVAFVVAQMMPATSRPRRELSAGATVRFRNKRHFFTTAAVASAVLLGMGAGGVAAALGPWAMVAFVCAVILGRVAFVFGVPPKGGRRYYEVTDRELVIRTPEEQLAIPWSEVGRLVHRPVATTQDGGYTTTHREHLELYRRRRAPRTRGGRGPDRAARRPIVIHGVFQQTTLSRLIIDHCREHLVRALRAEFDRDGELAYGDLRLTREGVHAPDGFLPWHTEWQYLHAYTEAGVLLTIAAPDEVTITGWVPVETIALDLLNALAGG